MNSMHGTDKQAAPSGDHEKTICELWEDIERYADFLQRPAGSTVGTLYQATVDRLTEELEELAMEDARLADDIFVHAHNVVRDERPCANSDFLGALTARRRNDPEAG